MQLPILPPFPSCAVLPFGSTADLLDYLARHPCAVYLGDVGGVRPKPGAHLSVLAQSPSETDARALRAAWDQFKRRTRQSYWRHAVRRSNKRGVPVAPIEHPSAARLAIVYDCL